MFLRIITLLSFIALVCLGALFSSTLSQAQVENKPEAKATQPINDLVKTASIILIAEVLNDQSSLSTPQSTDVPDKKIDIQKELDRAREETTYSSKALDIGSMVRLKTLETLKGPQTQILSLPITHKTLKDAAPGDLFLVMMGSNHPDAIRAISSIEDPWVQHVKATLE